MTLNHRLAAACICSNVSRDIFIAGRWLLFFLITWAEMVIKEGFSSVNCRMMTSPASTANQRFSPMTKTVLLAPCFPAGFREMFAS